MAEDKMNPATHAQSLKLPIGTVRTHLHRGRKKLREGIQRQQAVERGTTWQKTK